MEMDDLIALMAAETWMTADEALEKGFVDEIFDPAEPVENRYDLSAYQNSPDDFPRAHSQAGNEETDVLLVQPNLSDLEALVQRMEAAADVLLKPVGEAADELDQIADSVASQDTENSTQPVARTLASRERRLRLLERELSP